MSVHKVGASLEEILNAIAAEYPGTGWVLVRYQPQTEAFDRLCVLYPNGRMSESSYRLPIIATTKDVERR